MIYNLKYLKTATENNFSLIKILDLSKNNLYKIPEEIIHCKNVLHINILGNPKINWDNCFSKILKIK